MPFIPRVPTWPDPRAKPPFGSAEVDWGHPLAQGLIGCWLFEDLVARERSSFAQPRATVAGAPGFITGDLGGSASLDLPTDNDYFTVTRRSGAGIQTLNATCSLITRLRLYNTANVIHTMIDYGEVTDSNNALLFGVNTGAVPVSVAVGADNLNITSTNTFTFNAWTTVGVAQRSATDRTFLTANKLDVNSTTIGTGACAGGIAIGKTFANTLPQASGGLRGSSQFLYSWSRALSNGELLWVAAEPFAMLRPTMRVFYSAPPAAAAAAGSRVSPRSLALLGVGA